VTGPLGKRGRLWLGTTLVLLPVGIVALLWLGGRGPFDHRSRVALSPVVGMRARPTLAARGPAVVDEDPNDGVEDLDRDGDGEGDEAWLRDPDGLQPVMPRGCPAHGDCVIDFSYRDEQLLEDLHSGGGRVWIPAAARARGGRYPLVVLLHGTDGASAAASCASSSSSSSSASGASSAAASDSDSAAAARPDPLHRLLAPPLDLSRDFGRAIGRGVCAPVLVAAPSQTRDAHSSPALWTADGLDLADFVRVLDAELAALGSVRIDRRAVSVFGHSGAGCVVTPRERNGLFHVADQVGALRNQGIHVRLLGLMDICFHGYGGGRYLRDALAGTSTRVIAMWVEPETWFTSLDRDLDGFARGLGLHGPVPCDPRRYETCLGNKQGWWLFKARRQGLDQGRGSGPVDRDPPDDGHLTAHSAITRWFVQEALRRHFAPSSAR